MLSESDLKLVLEIQGLLSLPDAIDGKYSVYEFSKDGSLEYAGDTHTLRYIRDSIRGDYVTDGVLVDNVYTGRRVIVWAANVADPEFSESAETKGLPDILKAGDAFISLRDVSGRWIADKALAVPAKHWGMVQHGQPGVAGSVTIVPAMELKNA